MIRLSFDPGLVEEAVLLAEKRVAPADVRGFRRERDGIYGVADADLREARFQAVHLRWFQQLGLGSPIAEALRERPIVADGLADGRVVRAMTPREERADLVDWIPPDGQESRPMLVLRLRPILFLQADELRALLRHELLHVADMLDPAFGYERALPPSTDGPSYDNILRERYRVLWDVTVDGRLVRAGLLDDRAREARWHQFRTTFRLPSNQDRRVFDEWFEIVQPTHAALLAFIRTESATGTTHGTVQGRCPLCRFPVARLDLRPERLSVGARQAIQTVHPAWTPEQGLCTQCLDLYEAHDAEAHTR
jgi:hypothetical protein